MNQSRTYRTHYNDDRNLVIPLAETPFLSGILEGYLATYHEQLAEGKIPGSFLPLFRHMEAFAKDALAVMEEGSLPKEVKE